MNKEQKLKEIIEMAVKNGWEEDEAIEAETNPEQKFYFDHSFTKAFWGDKGTGMFNTCLCKKGCPSKEVKEWMLHLQQLAITPEKDRIDYLYKFVKTKS